MTLKKSIDVGSIQNIYVYISYTFTSTNEIFILFAKRCKYSVLTIEKSVFDQCTRDKINVLLAPKSALGFKKFLKNKQISLVVLAGDQFHGIYNYIARNYPSVFVQGASWNTYEFYQRRALKKDSVIYLAIYKLLSLTVTLFGREKIVYESSIKGILFALKEKIIWGLRNDNYFHGSFCNLIFLQGDWERRLFVENLVPDSKIRITGSISADFLVNNVHIAQNKFSDEKLSCDLLFFAQPLYLYPEYKEYLIELQQVVNKCSELNLNMIIKLHPRDDISFYKTFESKNCRLVEHSKSRSNNENISLIKASKVIMGKSSMSLLVPILMGKPVIFLDIMDSKLVYYKYYLDLDLLLTDINKFEEMYENLFDSEYRKYIINQQRNLLDAHGFYDGKSWKRIKKQIDLYFSE